MNHPVTEEEEENGDILRGADAEEDPAVNVSAEALEGEPRHAVEEGEEESGAAAGLRRIEEDLARNEDDDEAQRFDELYGEVVG